MAIGKKLYAKAVEVEILKMVPKFDVKQMFSDAEDFILAVMSLSSPGTIFNPVQIQKILFVLDSGAEEENQNGFFKFTVDKYGLYDQMVYELLDKLSMENCVEILPGKAYQRYVLKSKGFERSQDVFKNLQDGEFVEYVKELSNWALSCDYLELINTNFSVDSELNLKSVVAK